MEWGRTPGVSLWTVVFMIDWWVYMHIYTTVVVLVVLLHCFCIFLSIDLIRCAAILLLVSRVSLLSCLVRHVNLSSLFSLHSLPVPYAFMSSILSIRPSPSSLVMSHNWYAALGLRALGFIFCFCFPTCQGNGKSRVWPHHPSLPYWDLYLLPLTRRSLYCSYEAFKTLLLAPISE